MHLSNRLHTYICKICICVRSNIFLKYLPNILINIIWLSSGIPSSVFNLTYSNSKQISQILTYIHTHMRPYLYLYLVVCPRYCYCGCRHWILPTELHRLHNLHNLLNWAGKWHSKCQRNRRRQNSLLCCSWWWQISTSGAHGDQLATNTFSCMCIIHTFGRTFHKLQVRVQIRCQEIPRHDSSSAKILLLLYHSLKLYMRCETCCANVHDLQTYIVYMYVYILHTQHLCILAKEK